jgi:hypothetical protein
MIVTKVLTQAVIALCLVVACAHLVLGDQDRFVAFVALGVALLALERTRR